MNAFRAYFNLRDVLSDIESQLSRVSMWFNREIGYGGMDEDDDHEAD